MPRESLHELASAAGLQIDWEDAEGRPQRVWDEALARVLAALGFPAETEADIVHSLEKCREEQSSFLSLCADSGQPLDLPGCVGQASQAELALEDGTTGPVRLERAGGKTRVPGIDTIGYHRLRVDGAEIRLAISPARCFGIQEAAPGRRPWGVAVQVASLRDGQRKAFGDFGTLADAARRFAACGADALAISPVHALFPADTGRYSPYAPSSRLFFNILFGDPGLVGHPLSEAPAGALIDWHSAIPARLQSLREAYRALGDAHSEELVAYRAKNGEALERHALFDALHAHFRVAGARGWRDFPTDLQNPDGAEAACFARENRAEIDFYIFAQWLAEASLEAAQQAARRSGMATGLISDLAIGIDAGGSHAWSQREKLLTGLSVGAPPDPLGPDGQDWGITTFSPAALRRTGFEPLIETLRAALRHAGGLRIDHILGLNRLWVVPHGCPSTEGAYLTYPLEDMLRVLAIESTRAGAVVIGEDLGTVPRGLRGTLAGRGVLGMRVMWFERDDGGGFLAPEQWTREAVALTGTHDLPTVAGWWRGRDIDWTWKLGRRSQYEGEAHERAARAEDRSRLWKAFETSGAAEDPQPAPEQTGAVVDAAVSHVAGAACELALFPLEDVLALAEQPNLPGTVDQHPNWRRRMAHPTEQLLSQPDVAVRLGKIERSRS